MKRSKEEEMSAASAAALAIADDRVDERTAEYEDAIRQEGRRLYALAMSVLGAPAEAEDAVQDTMERAWRAWDQLKDPSKRAAWLATICLRRCFALRTRLRFMRRDARLDASDGPEIAVAADIVDTDLVRALQSLSNKQRAVVSLHYMYGYTLDDCAEIMGCGRGTARTHLARALARLRERLGDV